MTISANTFNAQGAQIVGTLTKDEWDEARAVADLVHIVSPEAHGGDW